MADETASPISETVPAADETVPLIDGLPRPADTETPNYHVYLWDTPLTYLCLLCQEVQHVPLDVVRDHVRRVHAADPVPTIVAWNPQQIRPELTLMAANAPTYYMQEGPDGQLRYVCCYCEAAGSEHWATDFVLFGQHMEQRHDGRLVMDEERSTGQEDEDGPAPGQPAQDQVSSQAATEAPAAPPASSPASPPAPEQAAPPERPEERSQEREG